MHYATCIIYSEHWNHIQISFVQRTYSLALKRLYPFIGFNDNAVVMSPGNKNVKTFCRKKLIPNHWKTTAQFCSWTPGIINRCSFLRCRALPDPVCEGPPTMKKLYFQHLNGNLDKQITVSYPWEPFPFATKRGKRHVARIWKKRATKWFLYSHVIKAE